jgi:hypothetical protein
MRAEFTLSIYFNGGEQKAMTAAAGGGRSTQ